MSQEIVHKLYSQVQRVAHEGILLPSVDLYARVRQNMQAQEVSAEPRALPHNTTVNATP